MLTSYWLFTFFLKFSFSPVCKYLNYMSPDFWRKLFKLFSLNTYCLVLIQCIFSHIFCKWWGTCSWDYWWESTKGGDMGEATQEQTTILLTTHRKKVFLEKGVPRKQAKSWKNIWRSSSFVNQQVESLQLYLKILLESKVNSL